MKLRLLLILPLSGGSLIVGTHLAHALSSMKEIELTVVATQALYDLHGKSFEHITDKNERKIMIIEHINLSAMGSVADFKPDLVLVMALAPISPWFIERVRQLGVHTAHWYIENFRYYPANPIIPRWQTIASYYDHFFTIQKGAFFDALEAMGVKHYHYLPTGCNPAIHKNIGGKDVSGSIHASDICFVGSVYLNRVSFFQALRGYDMALWGPGWPDIVELRDMTRGKGGWVNSQEETEIINGAKIGLNIHSNLQPGSMIDRGDFLNPRVFSIAACGTFQLVDEQEPLDDVLENGKEVATYHDLASLKSQLNYFLNNAAEREMIADHAMERVLEEHTYEKRMKEMLTIIGFH